MTSSHLDIRPAVAAALAANQPVVAMVSAPLSHTLPWPTNLETVRQVDEAVRREGATLAIITVLNGRLTVGLEAGEVEKLSRHPSVHWASRRDLAAGRLKGQTAGTTVSASMAVASKAGIHVLATGALGAARPFSGSETRVWDISSDLFELSQTPVAVVSSGARSVSELTYTTEVLETFRVPVLGYRTDFFPTYYMDVGSAPVSLRVNSPAEAAAFLQTHWAVGGSGVVLGQFTPADVAIQPDLLIPALRMIEESGEKDQVARKDLSPFLMDKLNRLTGGRAMRAYQSILVSNARLGAQIARELKPAAGK
jgi:pseudouridine-5'-phosphate glycosidase